MAGQSLEDGNTTSGEPRQLTLVPVSSERQKKTVVSIDRLFFNKQNLAGTTGPCGHSVA